MTEHMHIVLAPLFSWTWIVPAFCLSLFLVLMGFWMGARGTWIRALFLTLFFVMLVNPSALTEKHEPISDTVLVVVDDSASTSVGERRSQIDAAYATLAKKLSAFKDLNVETAHVAGTDETDLFQSIELKLSNIPKDRLAGVIVITDGQIHDRPLAAIPAPLHVLIAGHRDEMDRQLSVRQAPAYGIVGKKVTLLLNVTDTPKAQSETAPVTFYHDDGSAETFTVPVGRDVPFEVPIAHAGENLFAFETAPVNGELTILNNTASVKVNGVRDRLRVLLVSGEPHIGGRTWRNFLKADPAVDLVHFTILRSPLKENFVPNNQLALITFPVRELFEIKLQSFDLVIFDRFSNRSLVPDEYLDNIANYVEQGGSLLISNATDNHTDATLSDTPLSRLLPTQSTGQILTGSFVPALTDLGRRHPVTAGLEADMPRGQWGPWFRQTETRPSVGGDILMTGLQNQPLLVLNHAGRGRVAQFLSDQFWLWSRGYQNGGPQAELLRRVAHWLVQEPDLDETALRAHADYVNDQWQLTVTKASLHDDTETLSVIDPDGTPQQLTLASTPKSGMLAATLKVKKTGLYHVKDENKEIIVMVGSAQSLEFGAMVATQDKLENIVQQTHGAQFWLDDYTGTPEIKRVAGDGALAGHGWLGLKQNNQYRVIGSDSQSLLPVWATLLMLLVMIIWVWYREGRR